MWNEDCPAALDLLENVLLVLYPIALAGLFPLDDDGLANELIIRETLLRSHHLVVVA